ncbi:MAG: type I DNA topoisomerase [Lentisphaeria bacterium]|nr:type I DNA topoisomerase [Lentisphaeria bacterium]
MSKQLVIVESPAKARTIGRILPPEYIIKASMGHIRDLPENSFGVDIEHDFAPQYEESKARGHNLGELKTAAKNAQDIYLASDPDREGEAIAWHLQEVLRKINKNAKFHRVSFHEITRGAITRAFEAPGTIDMNRVDAQQARRVLDRIVGYQISPLLWSRIERGISAGRVQSVALRLVCEREREILAFIPKEYWVFEALFNPDAIPGRSFRAKLAKIDGQTIDVPDEKQAQELRALIDSATAWRIADLETAPRRKFAPPPFITSTLQQAASSAMGFTANQTMQTAQQLYEGITLANGPVGLITYMRTDAVNIAAEAQAACRDYIAKTFGADYVPPKPNFYKTKANAQAAHEAIRPTDVNLTPDMLRPYLNPAQLKLYTLIWRRFVACQMNPALLETTTVVVENPAPAAHVFSFRASATVTRFPGFLAVYNIKDETHSPEDDQDDSAPDPELLGLLRPGSSCSLSGCKPEQKFTEPAPRYSEATLIKELESNGIGRPSTYATIVNTIQVRKYVTREKGKLIPTDLGFRVNDYLVQSLPELFQVGFTADMEKKLDNVEDGEVEWTAMLRDFYGVFSGWLRQAKFADAPADDKAAALIRILSDFQDWEKPVPQPGVKRPFNEKTFFNSVVAKKKSGVPVTVKQWNALLSIAAKYRSRLPGIEEAVRRYGFEQELNAAADKLSARLEAIKERRAEQEAAVQKPDADPRLDAVFQAAEKVKWNKPERIRGRVYDDASFVESLRKQYASGKTLSAKQIAALLRVIRKYPGQFPENGLAAAAPVPPPNPAAKAQIDSLLNAFRSFESWNEPTVRRGRTFSDRDFIASLAKQHAAGKVLSEKQIAALERMAGKYNLKPV